MSKSIFEKVDQRQCPVCKFTKKCPARKVLLKDPEDTAALVLMRRGYCSQYAFNGKEVKDNNG